MPLPTISFVQLIGHQCITNHGVVDSFSYAGICNAADLRSNLIINLSIITLPFVLKNTELLGKQKTKQNKTKQKQVTTESVTCLK